MKKTGLFDIILLVVFGLFAIAGFVLFATYTGSKTTKDAVGPVVIWGTVDSSVMDRVLKKISKSDKSYTKVSYKEIRDNDYQKYLLNKFASGDYPDLFIISQSDLFFAMDKIYPIPKESFSDRNFNDNFIDAFNIFRGKEGVYAVPFIIDPLVMYYNKDILSSESISLPPKTWEDFIDFTKKVVKKDDNGNIKRSAVPFGVVANLNNFKEVISTLFLQLGNPIVYRENNKIKAYNDFRGNENPLPALRFFMEFSDPTSILYNWNKSLPDSKEYFFSGKLATYFGFLSESEELKKINPNLNFDVAEMPSVKKLDNKAVFVRSYALAVARGANNPRGAMMVASRLSSYDVQKNISKLIKLPPVRRDLLSEPVTDPILEIGYREAVYGKTFIDPDYQKTNSIFKFMIDAIYGGKYSPTESVSNAMKEINILLKGDY